MEGWIKLHRTIKDHWIWDDPIYFKAWVTILLTVNHEHKKVLIQGELIECKRGQSVLSLAGWVKCFGRRWTIQRVRTFFELLQKDEMISVEGLRKTTRITVSNYDIYQLEQQASNKQVTSKQHTGNKQITTNKNNKEGIKNEDNEKKEPNLCDSAPSKFDFIDLIIGEFKKSYEKANEISYSVINIGKERAAAGKLLKEYKKKNPDHNSEETLAELSNFFDRVVNINDAWLRTNMTLPILMSKFNEVINILRNGKSTNNKGATDREFLNAIAPHLTR